MRIGLLGGGQLGRMLALAGYPLGHEFTFLDPSSDAPMSPLAAGIISLFTDHAALDRLARDSDVVTFEFENVGREAAERIAARVPMFPPPAALEIKVDRLLEKRFFDQLNIPTAPYGDASTENELLKQINALGAPVVVKTRKFGYDGKGQAVARSAEDAASIWRALGGAPVIVEKFIQFEREVSIIAVRGRDGMIQFYPVGENVHRGGILRFTRAPAKLFNKSIVDQAQNHARAVLEKLHYVGVLAIEFFEVNGRLLANEMAPRVHNSGHWTIDGAATSQFENHIRAVTNAPLGSTELRRETAMINIIGDVPPVDRILQIPGAHLHLYGKEPRAGRKLGHINLCADAAPADFEKNFKILLKMTGNGDC